MQKFRTLFEKIGKKSKFFPPNFLRVKNFFHLPNFDTIPLAVRTVDGERLSEIAIHNFEKNRKSHSPLWILQTLQTFH